MTDDNSKTKFLINFKSLQIVDSPNIMGKEVFLKFVRNKNELNTKPNTVSSSSGMAEFNEKIEMKSFFEWDRNINNYKPKNSELQVHFKNGQKIGSIQINLSNYAKPNLYNQQFPLKSSIVDLNEKSYITIEIKTEDTKQADKNPKSPGLPRNKTGSKVVDDLQNKVDKMTMENSMKQ